MFRVVFATTSISGDRLITRCDLHDDYAQAYEEVENLRTNVLPEMGGIVDWTVRLYEGGKIRGNWSMDDEQPYYEHRILNRDNMDAAHYKTYLSYVSRVDAGQVYDEDGSD